MKKVTQYFGDLREELLDSIRRSIRSYEEEWGDNPNTVKVNIHEVILLKNCKYLNTKLNTLFGLKLIKDKKTPRGNTVVFKEELK